MTSKDDINVDDKDFDAFLKREGDLALLLQKLPQATPSAQLDAAILAAAKTEMEKAPAPPMQGMIAANDAEVPRNKSGGPSFIRRWRVPLGLAASLLVTVQLVRMEMTDEQTAPNAPALLLDRAVAPAPAPAPIESPPEMTTAEMRAPESKPVQEEQRKKARSDAAPVERELAKVEHKVDLAAKTAPADVQKPTAESYAGAPAKVAPARNTGDQPVRAEAPLSAHEPVTFSAPAPAQAPPPAPMARYSQQNADAAGSVSGRVVVDQRQAAAPAPQLDARPTAAVTATAVVADEATANPADAWLKKIDALQKAGSNQEALLEWRKFRKTYPEYVVPDALDQKMKSLDK